VVVVGYGTMRKSDVTGAVLRVSEAQLQIRPITDAMQALQGMAAGVDVTTNNRPGELGSITIRGNRSITASNSPLYVVDGAPILGRDNINFLNPSDIKSIDILKDASATAIYGSRGANGVILITTHKGEAGRFSVNYTGSVTFENRQDSREFYNAGEWIDQVRWGRYYLNPTVNPRGDQPNINSDYTFFYKGSDPTAWNNIAKGWGARQNEAGTWIPTHDWDPSKLTTTDWTKFTVQTGVTHNHTVNFSGGTERMSSFLSVGYLDQEGTNMGQRYTRYSVNSNNMIKPLTWLEVGGRLGATWQVQEYGPES